MNNTEENLYLFTKVEDGLPETFGDSPSDAVLCIIESEDEIYLESMSYSKDGWFDANNHYSNKKKVTHWLDLSKLTTKGFIEKSFIAGHNYALLEDGACSYPEFKRQNKI